MQERAPITILTSTDSIEKSTLGFSWRRTKFLEVLSIGVIPVIVMFSGNNGCYVSIFHL